MSKNIIYALACLFFTIMIGGAVYEHLVVVPTWSEAPPVSLSMFQGKYGLNPELFWMLVHPVNIVLLVTSLILSWRSERRKNILLPLVVYVVIIAITAVYFVPELLSITGTTYSEVADPSLTKRASLWETLSIARLAVLLIIAVYLFLGLPKPAGRSGN